MLVQVHNLDRYKQKWLKMLARVQTMDLCKHLYSRIVLIDFAGRVKGMGVLP